MIEKRNHLIDRRSEKDRRREYDLEYMDDGGVERRRMEERRLKKERRAGWLRVGDWYSICLQAIKGKMSQK